MIKYRKHWRKWLLTEHSKGISEKWFGEDVTTIGK